jgi:hypothetical protein
MSADATFDSWDVNRSLSWELMAGDHLVETLPDLYAVLGVADERLGVKIAVLKMFMESPTWFPAPAKLKAAAEEAVKGGG